MTDRRLPTVAQKERMLEVVEQAALEDDFAGVETGWDGEILLVRLTYPRGGEERRIAPDGGLAEPVGEEPR